MDKWEYQIAEDRIELDEMGRQGWEAYAVTHYEYESHGDTFRVWEYHVKRRISAFLRDGSYSEHMFVPKEGEEGGRE